MAHFLIKVNSITIRVPAHGSSETSSITNSGPIIGTSGCLLKSKNHVIIDGDSGSWTCPICGFKGTFSVNGNSNIYIDGKAACKSGVTYNIDHSGSLVSTNEEFETSINIT